MSMKVKESFGFHSISVSWVADPADRVYVPRQTVKTLRMASTIRNIRIVLEFSQG